MTIAPALQGKCNPVGLQNNLLGFFIDIIFGLDYKKSPIMAS